MRSGPRRAGGGRKAGRLPPEIQERLAGAQQMSETGDHASAATAFAQLAAQAHGRNRHGMATQMAIHATRQHVRAGDSDAAVAMARQAVAYAGPMQNRARVTRKFGELIAKITADG